MAPSFVREDGRVDDAIRPATGRDDDPAEVVQRYTRFAREEAPGRSELYAAWAEGVARDPQLARILARIPATRRQPPLVFAVTRMLDAPEGPFEQWAEWVRAHADDVVEEASRRRVQTNEPQRCAPLLPALATVAGPIALLELGVSAGLCLYPDRYSYRFRTGEEVVALDPSDGVSPVVLEAEVTGDPPLRLPHVVWRAGIDLEPLDAADAADRRFLTSLVWPGESGRAERVSAALDVVSADPPLLVAGDATDPDVLFGVAEFAPQDATLVVTTPGVLPHVPRAGRERLAAALRVLADRGAVWITIDPAGLHEWRHPVDPETWGGFVLGRDGEALAAVDPLGPFVRWRASRGGAGDAAVYR